jgi:hypothetical protein
VLTFSLILLLRAGYKLIWEIVTQVNALVTNSLVIFLKAFWFLVFFGGVLGIKKRRMNFFIPYCVGGNQTGYCFEWLLWLPEYNAAISIASKEYFAVQYSQSISILPSSAKIVSTSACGRVLMAAALRS